MIWYIYYNRFFLLIFYFPNFQAILVTLTIVVDMYHCASLNLCIIPFDVCLSYVILSINDHVNLDMLMIIFITSC